MPRTFYRVCKSWPATRQDFVSDEAKGKPPRRQQRENPILYRGISVRESAEELREVMARAGLSGMIVELVLPDNAPVEVHKTLGPGHYTLVCDPDQMLGFVLRLV